MHVCVLWSRYAKDLLIPSVVSHRVSKALSLWLAEEGFIGAHSRVKALCSRLRLWLISRTNGTEMPTMRDWVSHTRSGFPRLLDGLQEYSRDVLWKLVGLHKIFKPEDEGVPIPNKDITVKVDAVIRPYTGLRSALTEAQRLITLGSRLLSVPSIDDDTRDLSIYTPRQPLTPGGVVWLRKFFLKNEYWLDCCSGESIFAPYSVRQPVPTEWEIGTTYESFDKEDRRVIFDDPTFTYLGSYQLAAEPGMKARAYFAPNLAVQQLSIPLYKALEKVEIQSGRSVRYLETEAKLSQVQEWLREGSTVWSIDQSAATDRFHVNLQKFYLHTVGVDPAWIRFVHKLSIGKWHVSDAFKGVFREPTIKLAIGQPMGVKYSMPLYTVTMIALLEGACAAWGWKPDFLVLGDDVVIRDPMLAQWFEEFAPKIGLALSTTKGVVSDNLAEFAGAIIGEDWYIFPGKYPVPSKDNWMSRSESFARPLPGGPSGIPAVDAVAFWQARYSRLCGVWQLECPVYHRHAAQDLSALESPWTIDELARMHFDYRCEQTVRNILRIAKDLDRGRIISLDRWVAEHIGYVLGNQNYISDVFDQQEVSRGMQFMKLVLDTTYDAWSHVDKTEAQRLFSFCKPKGLSYESRVSHTFKRLAESIQSVQDRADSLSPLDRQIFVQALIGLIDTTRNSLWEIRALTRRRRESETRGFVSHLASSLAALQ